MSVYLVENDKVQYCVHVVDDDASIRKSLQGLLSDCGYIVYCYPNARSFLDRSPGAEGCALIDLKLGSIDGLMLQQRLIDEKSNLDIIMMSAYGEVADAVKAMRLGAIDYLEKPFSPEELLARIRSLREIRDSDEIARSRARSSAAQVASLTPREKQVMSMVVDGFMNKEIARGLHISRRTVETHRRHIMDKLRADSLPELVRIWIAAGRHLETPAP